MKNYRKRIADDILKRKLEGKGAVLIEGPKWCGKTTTAEQFAASILYMDDSEKKEQHQIELFCLDHKRNNYVGIIICLYTGIRLGELLALTWDDIDFTTNLLSINKTSYSVKIDGKTQIVVDKPKTKKSIRVIPIPEQITKVLKIVKRHSTSKYVITTRNNTMVGNRSYQRTFEYILRHLNIPYRNFHSLRHTFATNAIELGMDVKTLAEILGHTNAMITLNRYSHSMLSYKIEMMNKLGKTLISNLKNR